MAQSREELQAYQRLWRKEHPGATAGYSKKYREAHPERKAEADKAYHKAHPEKLRARAKKWHDANPEKAAANTKKWYDAHPEIRKANTLKKYYDMTLEEYSAMFDAQHGLCSICHNPPKKNNLLCVDHDHKTGKIRGLLCRSCNLVLGNSRDSIELLSSAILYLERNGL
jgi:hypothetical protein